MDALLGGAAGRWPRLWLPTSLAAMTYYAWLHFGPWRGGFVCHNPGDIDQYADFESEFVSGPEMVLNAALGQWFFQDAVYSIEWTLQIEFLYSILVFIFACAITSECIIDLPRVRIGCYFAVIFLPFRVSQEWASIFRSQSHTLFRSSLAI